MKHYLLIYNFVGDYVDRRAALRSAHLEKAWAAAGEGHLVLGGALTDPVDTGVLLFKGETPDFAETFARTDPYVTEGLVVSWKVREWTTVVGADALTAVRP